MKKITPFIFVILVYSIQAKDCGKWRWSIKTLTDQGALDLLNQQPTSTTISQILTDPEPLSHHLATTSPQDGQLPRFDSEKQLVVFTANIIEVKHEADHDYHLVLKDPNTNEEMVAEIPDPNCPSFSGISELQNRFQILRDWVDNNVSGTSGDGDPAITVQIQGIKFFDAPLHATGSPPNGREIHPVTDIITSEGSVFASAGHLAPAELIKSVPVNPNNNPSKPSTNMNTTTTPQNMLYLVLLAALLGMAGQVIRLMVGLKKTNQGAPPNADGTKKSTVELVDGKQLALGLFIAIAIGAIAGILAAVNNMGISELSKSDIFAFIAAGYAGTDLIEGFVINK